MKHPRTLMKLPYDCPKACNGPWNVLETSLKAYGNLGHSFEFFINDLKDALKRLEMPLKPSGNSPGFQLEAPKKPFECP